MRFAVLADVHGNFPALQAVVHDLKSRQPDGWIVAGDFIGGPCPDKIITLLQSLKPNWMILGNSDINLLRYINGQMPEACRTAKQFALLRWACSHISAKSIEFLQNLPQQQVVAFNGIPSIHIVHGSLDDPFDGYDPEAESEKFNFDLHRLEETVLVCGHTHRQWVVERNGKLAFNPGSVAGPLNGYIGAQYALLDQVDGSLKVQLLALPYDISRIRHDFLESGLLVAGGALARCFLHSIENGEDVSGHFLHHASTLAVQAGYSDCQVIPDDIWEQAEASFDWKRRNKAND